MKTAECRVQSVQRTTGLSAHDMSGIFSPLTAPLPLRVLPLRAPLRSSLFSDSCSPLCSPHLTFWPAALRFPLRSNALVDRILIAP